MANFDFESNLFGANGITTYGGNYEEKARRAFSDAELNAIKGTECTETTFEDGNTQKSICFFLNNGRKSFVTLSTKGKDVPVGASVDLTKCNLVKIQRDGEEAKLRIEVM